MSMKKNNSNLSIEERLEQALIPNWDEPYKLPDNWCWTKLNVISEVVTGSTPSKNKPEYYGDDFPFFKPADLEAGRHTVVASEYLSELGKNVSRVIPAEATAVCCIGSIGKSGYLEVDGTTNQQINSVIPKINPLYLYYYINSDTFINELREKASATTVSIINKSKMEANRIPVAPLKEQQRIVERIESLFTILDEAKEKAQEVVDGFESRKAAILHKAFSGELTARWRKENNIECKGYKRKRFDEVAIIKSNLVNPLEYLSYPHIAPDNIEKKTGTLLEYRTIEEDNVKSGKHKFYSGQILYSKIRPNLSKVVVVDFEGLCSADMYPIEAIGDTRCLWYFMLSENFLEQASVAGTRTVLPKINQKELSALTVTIPDFIEEQEEIVRILDSLLEKEYQVKQIAEVVIKQIDIIKKVILAKAFRGELGTNDSTEESAKNLLKRLLDEM